MAFIHNPKGMHEHERDSYPYFKCKCGEFEHYFPDESPRYETQAPFGFGDALTALRDGKSVYREGWHGVGMFLTMQVPDQMSKMSLPYIFITVPKQDGDPVKVGERIVNLVPWVASQADLLAYDWRLLNVI